MFHLHRPESPVCPGKAVYERRRALADLAFFRRILDSREKTTWPLIILKHEPSRIYCVVFNVMMHARAVYGIFVLLVAFLYCW